jgi:hypothetical protein
MLHFLFLTIPYLNLYTAVFHYIFISSSLSIFHVRAQTGCWNIVNIIHSVSLLSIIEYMTKTDKRTKQLNKQTAHYALRYSTVRFMKNASKSQLHVLVWGSCTSNDFNYILSSFYFILFYFIYGKFNVPINISDYIAWDNRIINEYWAIWKEVVVA